MQIKVFVSEECTHSIQVQTKTIVHILLKKANCWFDKSTVAYMVFAL